MAQLWFARLKMINVVGCSLVGGADIRRFAGEASGSSQTQLCEFDKRQEFWALRMLGIGMRLVSG